MAAPLLHPKVPATNAHRIEAVVDRTLARIRSRRLATLNHTVVYLLLESPSTADLLTGSATESDG